MGPGRVDRPAAKPEAVFRSKNSAAKFYPLDSGIFWRLLQNGLVIFVGTVEFYMRLPKIVAFFWHIW
jgi:hypothetical protein